LQQTLSPDTHTPAPDEATYVCKLQLSRSFVERSFFFLQTTYTFIFRSSHRHTSRCSYKMAATDTSSNTIPDTASNTSSWYPKRTSTYDKDDTITLIVGPEKHEMTAYGGYLSKSQFFQAALKKEWTEGQTRTIKLLEEKPAVVAQYLDFVLNEGLPTRFTKNDYREGAVYDLLGELYGLGERILDSPLRNAIIHEIVRFTTVGGYPRCYPQDDAINTIYECTTNGSPARRLLVFWFITNGKENWVTDDLHPEFLRDVAKASISQFHNCGLKFRFQFAKAEDYHV
jgi:hypothetical protein